MKRKLRRTARWLISAALVFALFTSRVLVALADTGTITANNVNVRPQASTAGNPIGQVNQGQTFEIEGSEQDATGMTWYKITLNGQTGYVRQDFINVTTDGGDAQTGGDDQTGNGDATGTVDTPERNATVNATGAVFVRNGPGQNYAQTESLQPNDPVIVTGEATDNNGVLWYRIRFNENSEGYVSGAFLSIEETPVDTTPPDTGTDISSPVTTDPNAGNSDGLMGQQYTVVYDLDDAGNMAPYLSDNNSGDRYNVQDLLQDRANLLRLQGVERSNTVLKIIAIILGIITLVAVILLLMVMLRFRRYRDDDYDDDASDDDYDDEEEEDAPKRGLFGRRREAYDDDEEEDDDYDDEEEDDDYRDGRRRGGFFSRFRRGRDDYDDDDDYDDEEDDDEEEAPRAIRQVVSPERNAYEEAPRNRRVQNFMEDEDADDFEYGFLNDDR